MSDKIVIGGISLPYKAPSGEAIAAARRRVRPHKALSAEIYKRSVDARKKHDIRFVYSVLLTLDCDVSRLPNGFLSKLPAAVLDDKIINTEPGTKPMSGRPVIIGFGPCGMFCALRLAEAGYAPIILERGGPVGERAQAVARFYESGVLDTENNIQFGAGGAGTFSDGKLTTRINDPRCRYVLDKLVSLGAPAEISREAKPHIGTDRLTKVIENAAGQIIKLGGEIRYNTRADDIRRAEDGWVIKTAGDEIFAPVVILAVGHSARDTYAMAAKRGFTLERKPFSVGVRIEHLRRDIDTAMYGAAAGDPLLGAADYNFSLREGERAVYTFCMCPGGEVVGAASEEGGVCVNGMSRYLRDGVNSNSALAVAVAPENPIEFQRTLERAAYCAAGGGYRAPVQTVGGFFDGRRDSSLGAVKPSYAGGGERVTLCELGSILPTDVSEMLKRGIADFGRKLHGFDDRGALLTGVETRTSAPIRILRGDDLCAPGFPGIYPAGEGAGYAGGIMSASVDGLRCAESIISLYAPCFG